MITEHTPRQFPLLMLAGRFIQRGLGVAIRYRGGATPPMPRNGKYGWDERGFPWMTALGLARRAIAIPILFFLFFFSMRNEKIGYKDVPRHTA